jgi:hypothetical protein
MHRFVLASSQSFARLSKRAFRITPLLMASLLFASGCTPRATTNSGNRNVITSDEVRELTRLSAFEIVQRLRPMWLQPRGVDSFRQSNAVAGYLDGLRIGDVSALRNIRANDIKEIRYLDSRQATTRFGVGHPSGAVLVETRR